MGLRREPNVIPGFGITFGFTTFFLVRHRAAAADRAGDEGRGHGLAALRRRGHRSARAGLVPTDLRRLADRPPPSTSCSASSSPGRWCATAFPGRRFIDAIIDMPFALPTAVSGIALTAVFAGNGWIGQYLEPLGIKVAYTPLGITVALTLIGMPFVVRTVQPALQELPQDVEEAAETLGAGPAYTFFRVILPAVLPALLTGFTLAFARAVGEYGSVIFIAGNIPMKTEITPLLIVIRLEEYDYAAAAALGCVMLAISFVMLLAINLLQAWGRAPTCSGRERADGPRSLPHRRSRCCSSARCCSRRWRWCSPSALREGLGACFESFADSDTRRRHPPHADHRGHRRAAEHGVRHLRRLVHRQVRVPRQEHPDHADRPAAGRIAGGLGPDLRAAVRPAGLVRRLAAGARHQHHLRAARHRAGHDVRHLPLRGARADPADAAAGQRRGRGGHHAGRRRLVHVLPCDAAAHPLGPDLRRDPVQRARHGRVRRRLGGVRPHPRPDQHHAAAHRDPLPGIQLRRRLCRGLAAVAAGRGHADHQDAGRMAHGRRHRVADEAQQPRLVAGRASTCCIVLLVAAGISWFAIEHAASAWPTASSASACSWPAPTRAPSSRASAKTR